MLPYSTLVEALFAAPADTPFITMCEGDEAVQMVTYGDFRRLAQAQAAAFQAAGLRESDRLVLILPQGIPLMTAFVGAMLLGAVPAILAYPSFKLDPVKYRIGLSGVAKNLR